MELDLEPITLLVTGGLWAFILVLVWATPYGFERTFEKMVLTIASLPIIYVIVVMQRNR